MKRARTGLLGAMALVIGLCPAWLGSTRPAAESPDFSSAIRAHGPSLALVASDEEALALFSSRLAQALDLPDSAAVATARPGTSSGRQADASSADEAAPQEGIAREVRDVAARLTAALAAWKIASALKETAGSGDHAAAKSAMEQAAGQTDWLKEKGAAPSLARVLELNGSLIAVPDVADVQSDAAPEYVRYAAYLDRTYPRLIGSDDSWLTLAEQEGSRGIHRRLAEYWKTPGAAQDDSFAARYFNTRLRPVLTAQAIAQAVRMEAEAERQTREAWSRLRTWRDRMKELKGLSRLCGTWQWTVHNHKHHQDHKMVMVFPPPSPDGKFESAGPAKVTVLGDTVYLRWESQGGVQEDSLLFVGEDRRLEGTFVNSAGAWGSITGKRVHPCPKNK